MIKCPDDYEHRDWGAAGKLMQGVQQKVWPLKKEAAKPLLVEAENVVWPSVRALMLYII